MALKPTLSGMYNDTEGSPELPAGGLTGEVLAKNSNADYDVEWIVASGLGTVTTVGWTGGIVSIANATTTPAFTIAGTSGGIPYFSSGSTWATSAALAAGSVVIGGGAGVAPSTLTLGTAGQALKINAGATAVEYGTLGYLGGGTNATTQAGAVTNMQGAKIFASGAALQAATPTVAGQLAISTDGSFAIGFNTSAGGYVAGGASILNPQLYTLGLEIGGNLTQTAGFTSQLRTLTITTGGISVTSGNVTLSAGSIFSTASGFDNYFKVGGAFVDNALNIHNTSSTGASKGYSAIAFWSPADTYKGGRALATGFGPDVSNEYGNRAYFSTNPTISTDPPPDIVFGQERNDGTPSNQHNRILIDGTNKRIRLYGWDTTNAADTAFVEVDENGLLTANSGLTVSGGNVILAPTSAGTVTIGGGATASSLIFMEPSGSGTNKVTLTAPALAADRAIAWPDAAGTIAVSNGPASATVLYSATTDQTIANETETVINTVTIPGAWVADGASIAFHLLITQSNSGAGTITVLAKVGGTDVINDVTASLGSGSQSRALRVSGQIDFTNISAGTCTAQVFLHMLESSASSATTGTGDLGSAAAVNTCISGAKTGLTVGADTTFFLSFAASANYTLVVHSVKMIAART